MWKKFVNKLLMMLLPHLSCILVRTAKHLAKEVGVCEICDSCLCSSDGSIVALLDSREEHCLVKIENGGVSRAEAK